MLETSINSIGFYYCLCFVIENSYCCITKKAERGGESLSLPSSYPVNPTPSFIGERKNQAGRMEGG